MTESQGYRSVRNKLRTYPVFFQRIESGVTGIGIPDVFFRTRSTEGWIELKSISTLKVRKKVKMPFRVGQLSWIERYRKLGGQILVFCFVNDSLAVIANNKIQEEYTYQSFIDSCCLLKTLRKTTGEDLYKVLYCL